MMTDTPSGEVVVLSNADRKKIAALPADERELIEQVLTKFTVY